VKDWSLGRRESAIRREWKCAAADVAERRMTTCKAQPKARTVLSASLGGELLCPRLACNPHGSKAILSIFIFLSQFPCCPCLQVPRWPRAQRRPELCPVILPFQEHSDSHTLIILGSAHVQSGEVIPVAEGWVFHYWRCPTSRGTIRNTTRNLT
jgi:hypothetical protein